MASRLAVRVEGPAGAISAQAFADVLRTSLNMLQELDRADPRLGARTGVWLLQDLRIGSAEATLGLAEVESSEAPERLVGGLRQLREAEELPQFFSPKLATNVARMGGYIGHAGVSGVSCCVLSQGAPDISEAITADVVAHARASAQAVDHALGSAIGVLDIINIRHGQRVSLFDEESGRAVQCRVPAQSLEDVRGALGHRVRAIGMVTRNRRGQILRVDAQELERLGDDRPLPSAADLAGVAPWYTGELSTDEYLRWTRHE